MTEAMKKEMNRQGAEDAEGLISYDTMDSPVGTLIVTTRADALIGVYMAGARHAPEIGARWRRDCAGTRAAIDQLGQYFAGERTQFDLPLAPRGTAFQLRVWRALREIEYGATISYGELARRVGSPAAVRAVGAANGRNPLSLVVPCHRVVGSDGSLTGYAGGLERKRWLLEHEVARAQRLALPIELFGRSAVNSLPTL
jgi:methylated-DNA-[protein]-cysteine S-methyltransferase